MIQNPMDLLDGPGRALYDDLQDEIPFLDGTPYVPTENKWTNLIGEASSNTPDFISLKNGKEKEFLILVCDNLQVGRALNHQLRGANYYGRGETVYGGFVLKKSRDGIAVPFRMKKIGYQGKQGFAYPNGALCIRTFDVGMIEGDIYGVPLRLLCTIDKIRQNGIKCQRQRNLLRMAHPRQNNMYARGFVYEGNHIWYTNDGTEPQFMSGTSMKIRMNQNVLFH